MHQALYRRFRPETFEGILGQNHIVRILQNQIRSDAIGHAYLFCGTRGTGKTTTARILAKGANCTAHVEMRPCGVCHNCIAIRDGIFLDVIEIDAASNNGVENIRELRESVKYAPVTGKFKVYIIDEVHMLSAGAYNALLKTLEEPPEYVIFILATTEPQKLPATILSRCMRLDFRRVSEKLLIENMQEISRGLNVDISKDALGIIASNGDGSVRDSLSLLDQCLAANDKVVTREDVLDVLGTKGEEAFILITDLVEEGKASDILLFIEDMISEGIEVRQFIKDWIGHYRNLMMIKFVSHPENILNLSEENIERMREQSTRIQMSAIDYNILQLADTASEVKWSTQPRILLELCAIRLAARGGFIEKNNAGAFEEEKEEIAKAGKQPNTNAEAGAKDIKEEFEIEVEVEAKEESEADAKKKPAAEGKEEPEAGAKDIKEKFEIEDKEEAKSEYKKRPEVEAKGESEAEARKKPAAEAKEESEAGAKKKPEVEVKEEPEIGTKPSANLGRLWNKIVEEGASQKGSLRILGDRCRPICIKGNCLHLELDNEIAMRYVNDNFDILKDLIEKHMGRALVTECILCEGKPQNKQQKTAEERAKEVGNRLNINVEVK